MRKKFAEYTKMIVSNSSGVCEERNKVMIMKKILLIGLMVSTGFSCWGMERRGTGNGAQQRFSAAPVLFSAAVLSNVRYPKGSMTYADRSRPVINSGYDSSLGYPPSSAAGYKTAGPGGVRHKGFDLKQPGIRGYVVEKHTAVAKPISEGVISARSQLLEEMHDKMQLAVETETDDDLLLDAQFKLYDVYTDLVEHLKVDEIQKKSGNKTTWDAVYSEWLDVWSSWGQRHHDIIQQEKHAEKVLKKGFNSHSDVNGKERRALIRSINLASGKLTNSEFEGFCRDSRTVKKLRNKPESKDPKKEKELRAQKAGKKAGLNLGSHDAAADEESMDAVEKLKQRKEEMVEIKKKTDAFFAELAAFYPELDFSAFSEKKEIDDFISSMPFDLDAHWGDLVSGLEERANAFRDYLDGVKEYKGSIDARDEYLRTIKRKVYSLNLLKKKILQEVKKTDNYSAQDEAVFNAIQKDLEKVYSKMESSIGWCRFEMQQGVCPDKSAEWDKLDEEYFGIISRIEQLENRLKDFKALDRSIESAAVDWTKLGRSLDELCQEMCEVICLATEDQWLSLKQEWDNTSTRCSLCKQRILELNSLNYQDPVEGVDFGKLDKNFDGIRQEMGDLLYSCDEAQWIEAKQEWASFAKRVDTVRARMQELKELPVSASIEGVNFDKLGKSFDGIRQTMEEMLYSCSEDVWGELKEEWSSVEKLVTRYRSRLQQFGALSYQDPLSQIDFGKIGRLPSEIRQLMEDALYTSEDGEWEHLVEEWDSVRTQIAKFNGRIEDLVRLQNLFSKIKTTASLEGNHQYQKNYAQKYSESHENYKLLVDSLYVIDADEYWNKVVQECSDAIKQTSTLQKRIDDLEDLRKQIESVQSIQGLIRDSALDFAELETKFVTAICAEMTENISSASDEEWAQLEARRQSIQERVDTIKDRIAKLAELKRSLETIDEAGEFNGEYSTELNEMIRDFNETYNHLVTTIYSSEQESWGAWKSKCDSLTDEIVTIQKRIREYEKVCQQLGATKEIGKLAKGPRKDFITDELVSIETGYMDEIVASIRAALYVPSKESWAETMQKSTPVTSSLPIVKQRVKYLEELQSIIAAIESDCQTDTVKAKCFTSLKKDVKRMSDHMLSTVYTCGFAGNDTWGKWRQKCDSFKERREFITKGFSALEQLKNQRDLLRKPSFREPLSKISGSMISELALCLSDKFDEWNSKLVLFAELVGLAGADNQKGFESKLTEWEAAYGVDVLSDQVTTLALEE